MAPRLARQADFGWLSKRETTMRVDELSAVLAANRILITEDHSQPLGWLRWGLFWDEIPFMNMLFVLEAHRGRGVGGALVDKWEAHCRYQGRKLLMTSTSSDEVSQRFYRHRGYEDCGAFVLPGEPTELILHKRIV